MIYSINQNRWSFASGEISLNGNTYVGLQSFDPKEEVKKEGVYGNGRVKVGRVRGQHSAEASFDMLLTEFDQLLQDLGDGATDVPFDIVVTYSEVNGDGEYTIEVSQATIVSAEQKASNDGKAIVMSVSVDIVEPIVWNGIRLVDDTSSGIDFSAFGLSITF